MSLIDNHSIAVLSQQRQAELRREAAAGRLAAAASGSAPGGAPDAVQPVTAVDVRGWLALVAPTERG